MDCDCTMHIVCAVLHNVVPVCPLYPSTLIHFSLPPPTHPFTNSLSLRAFSLPPPPSSPQLLLWYIPLTCYLNSLLSPSRSQRPSTCCPFIIHHSLMLPLFLLHCIIWSRELSPYGTIVFIVSPGVTWTIPMSIYLVFRSWRSHYRANNRS